MSEKFALIDNFLGYNTNDDESKVDVRYLRSGSQNVLVDRENKCGVRAGYTFALEGGESDDSCVSGGNWENSKSTNMLWRMDDDGTNGVLRVYFSTIDTVAQNTW